MYVGMYVCEKCNQQKSTNGTLIRAINQHELCHDCFHAFWEWIFFEWVNQSVENKDAKTNP